jgi:hypothetical protein
LALIFSWSTLFDSVKLRASAQPRAKRDKTMAEKQPAAAERKHERSCAAPDCGGHVHSG